MSTVMDYIINLLFTLLQIVANDKIISHIVIMILFEADLMEKMPKKYSTRRFCQQIIIVTVFRKRNNVDNMYDRLLRALVSYMRHGNQRRDTFDS